MRPLRTTLLVSRKAGTAITDGNKEYICALNPMRLQVDMALVRSTDPLRLA